LFRRGNFNGSFDQLILDALLETQDAEIAFSPGFRWGTSILPGDAITFEDVMNMSAITYPYVTNTVITGDNLKNLLEDICDNLFNPDPYYQQGGDMVRVGGMQFSLDPLAKMGSRIGDMRLKGQPLQADKNYKVAGWAPVAEEARSQGNPQVWTVVEQWLKAQGGRVKPRQINTPTLTSGLPNPGHA
jgi:sulfur-oxidizing protein SoxB